MAVLTITELSELRRNCAVGQIVNYDKAKINAALQAIEDWFEANRTSISTAIDATGFTFTAGQKKRMIAYWLANKFIREGV